MSDTSIPPERSPGPLDGRGPEVEVDLATFLPEGVELEAEPVPEEGASAEAQAPAAPSVDVEALAQIERDLDAVDAAIAALDAGTYGTDQASGEPIPAALLAEDPTRLTR